MKTTITVHHVKDANNVEADIKLYCGRNGSKYPSLIDAKMGNPHPVDYKCSFCNVVHARGEACNAYRNTLDFNPEHPHWKRIKRIGLRLTEGKSVALFCYCKPRACHCDTIAELARLEVKP